MSQGGIGTEWSSWSPVGRGGDKDRPTRDVSTLPPWFTANGQARLAPSSTWRTEDTSVFNRWRYASSLFVFQLRFLVVHVGSQPASRAMILAVCLSRRLSYYRFSDLFGRRRWSACIRSTSTLLDNRELN